MTDQELFSNIQSGGRKFDLATQHILQAHVGMMSDIKKKLYLQNADIKDLYADAISSLIWNIRTNKFNSESKISTYLYRIFYNKSVDHLRHTTTNKNAAYLELDEKVAKSIIYDNRNLDSTIDAELIKKEINSLGAVCKGVLLDWAYWGYSMLEIAERNNLENADKAKKRKYECLKKLRQILKTKGIW